MSFSAFGPTPTQYRALPLLLLGGAMVLWATPTWAADKNGVSPNAISLPSGPGSIEGLGESFEPSLNSGTARYGLGFQLPPGPAGYGPSLRLSYDGGQGNGPLGFGWQLPVPFVQRQTDKGIPRYVDGANNKDDDRDGQIDEVDELDTFITDSKEELVPTADGHYFAENESEFIRYRRVGAHWEGTLPNGTRMEFGLTDEGRVFDSAATNRVYKWLLQRQTDTRGNTILYSWQEFPGATNRHQKFLKEVRYGAGAPPWTHCHFAAFEYEGRSDWFEDGRSGFIVRTGQRLKEVRIGTVGSTAVGHATGDFNGDGQSDSLNRIYRLSYLDYAPGQSHWSLLRQVTQIGADGVSALPPATFGYAVCHPPASLSAAGQFVGGTNEPPFAMDNANVELADLNGDALPDLLRTGAAGGAHIAYLNQGEQLHGTNRVVAWGPGQQMASTDGFAWNVTLQSATDVANLSDMNGDGLADLAYKSALGDVFYFANQGALGWGARQLMNPQDTQPPAPYGNANVRSADIDFDKRIDVIESIASGGGADYRIWLNLGSQRYARSLTVPQNVGFMFNVAGVLVADFNGDRVPDIVRIQPSSITVLAGLGYGNFAAPITVPILDWTLDSTQIGKARLEDITGDGLADVVIERAAPGQVWYWINRGNYTVDARRMITGLPGGLGATTRWADLDGNGTTDLIFADSAATPKILSVDLGRLLGSLPAPNTLTTIDNGIGRVQTLEYAPSTRFAMEDAALGQAWTNRLPFPVTVVSRLLTSDSLGHTYETRFRYHQGYYDAVEKEFRGFASAEQIETGDSTAPTLVSRSYFDTGRQFESMKGKLLRLTTEQEDGKAFWDEVTTWTTPPRALYSGTNGQTVKFIHQTGRTKTVLELGVGAPRSVESEFAYDQYGNQTLEANYGIVENGDRSAFDDERITTNEFALNLAAWIVRHPSRTEIRDENGVVTSRVENFYDDETFAGNNLGTVTTGNQTMRREWHTPSDASGFVTSTRTRFDAYGNGIAVLDPLAEAPGGLPDAAKGHFRAVTYDAEFHAHAIRETVHIGGDRAPLVMEAGYDPGFGMMVVSRDYNGHETAYAYDAFARLRHIIKPGDTAAYPTTEHDYFLAVPAGAGRVVNFVETRALDKTPGTAGDKRGHYFISRTFSDGLGRTWLIKKEAEAASGSSQPRVTLHGATIFNARQKPAQVLNPCFTTMAGTLDEILGFEDVAQPGWQGSFHEQGQLLALGLAAAHKTETQYDATLREIRKTNPDGTFTRNEFQPFVEWRYDENDTTPESPHEGTPKVIHQDGLGRQIKTEEVVRLNDDGTPSGALKTWTTTFGYDLNDQLTRTVDSQGNTKRMVIDGLKRLVSMNDPDRGVSTNVYDLASNRIETRDAKGQRITYTYDGANRLLTEDYRDEGLPFSAGHAFNPALPISTANRPDIAYFYDVPVAGLDLGDGTTGTAQNVKGMLAYVWDLSGEEHRSYDGRRRDDWTVKRVLDPVNGRLVSFQTKRSFDSLDRLKSWVFPDNDVLNYSYNDRSFLDGVAGGLSGPVLQGIEYLPSGQVTRNQSGNGVETSWSYDRRARLTSLLIAPETAPAQPLVAFNYAFDGVSNLESIHDGRPAAVVPAGSPRRNSQRFDYDELYRLKRVRYSFGIGDAISENGQIEYRYDRIGNLLAQSSDLSHLEDGRSVTDLGTLSYGGAAGTANRDGRSGAEPGPHALSQISGQPNSTLAYDANGNVTQQHGGALTWDFKDRLVAAEDQKSRAEYTYDYKHRRITRRVVSKADGTNVVSSGKSEVTFYVDPSFEVRPPELPIKYVWNGSTRIARVNGSFSNQPRIQRIRLAVGWNLVSLVVTTPNFLAQLPAAPAADSHQPTIDAVRRWDAGTKSFTPVAAGALPAGTVLWLHATSPGTVSISGEFVDPSGMSATTEAGFVQWPGFDLLRLSALPGDTGGWFFDASVQSWRDQIPSPLEMPSGLPEALAPGGAMFVKPGNNPVQLVAPDTSLRFRYYHQDHLGSSSVMTDANGQLIEETAYYPFGVARHVHTPRSTKEAYGFTQKERDQETGLHYFEARYLSGAAGRFISVDPAYAEPLQLSAKRFQALLDNPQDLNLYTYARNNPILYVDPSGYGLELDVPETKSAEVKPAAESKAGPVTVMSGHGVYLRPEDLKQKANGHYTASKEALKNQPGTMVVPEGTTITFYAHHGQTITDELGGAIELQQLKSEQYRVTYHPGDVIPNYSLLPASDLTVFTRPGINNVQVDRPTSLKDLLKPGMGAVHWAACQEVVGQQNTTMAEVGQFDD